MRLLRPLLATLALSLTLPLSAATKEKTVHIDTEPYVVPAGEKKFTDYIKDISGKDVEGALFWFRLQPGATLTINVGLLNATLLIETAAEPQNPATLVFTDKGLQWPINSQKSPIKLLRAPNVPDGTLVLASDSWKEYDKINKIASAPLWTPKSLKVDCNLTFATPLPVDSDGNAYVTNTFIIPSGRTFRIETNPSEENQLPEIAFTDETSTLVFAGTTADKDLAQKYCTLLESSSGRFIFERDTTITPQLTFTGSPTIEISGKKLNFSDPLLRNGGSPSILLKEGGILSGRNLSTVIVEGEVEIKDSSSLDYLTGNGTVNDPTASSITIKAIRVEEGNELKTTNSFFIKDLQEIKGGGTLRLESVRNNETLCDWKALDEILRKGGFTGVFGYTSGTYFTDIDFSKIEENTFDYTLMPYFREGSTSSTIITIKMRLEQYVNLKIKWPTTRLNQISLELIESGSFKGNATVPAFPEEIKFSLFRTDDKQIEDCEVINYGTVTNTLSWEPSQSAMAGFTGLPDVVNQTLIAELLKEDPGKTPGTVIGKTSTEATKALECFSGIYAFVDQENSDTVDLNVDYAFGISRLTFVDGGENILVEVSLTSDVDATTTPTFLGVPTLFADGNPLDVTPLTDEEIAKRGLSAPNGSTTLWFVVPYNTLPDAGDHAITVSANPPQAN